MRARMWAYYDYRLTFLPEYFLFVNDDTGAAAGNHAGGAALTTASATVTIATTAVLTTTTTTMLTRTCTRLRARARLCLRARSRTPVSSPSLLPVEQVQLRRCAEVLTDAFAAALGAAAPVPSRIAAPSKLSTTPLRLVGAFVYVCAHGSVCVDVSRPVVYYSMRAVCVPAVQNQRILSLWTT